jgi:hypothetical protein
MIAAPATVAGPILFARYAFGPNRLGYCGPDDSAELFGEATRGGDLASLRHQAEQFEGAYPYLQLIARANGLSDPLDTRVVEAYWLGNELLSHVTPRLMGDSLDQRFRRRVDANGWRWLSDKPNMGAVPVHAFHVLDIFSRVGLMRTGATDNALAVMDSCRIRWGRVLERDGDYLIISGVPLTMVAGKLQLGCSRVERIRAWQDGIGFVADVSAGDVVSIHWDWACDVLDAHRLASLQAWTKRELGIANLTM